MPCTCWYDPGEENKKYIKDLCVLIVERVKFLNKDADASGCELTDVHKLIDHLYSGKCDENPNEESSFPCSKCKKKAKGEWRKGYSDQDIFICNDCLGKGSPS